MAPMDSRDGQATQSPVPIAVVGYSFEFPENATACEGFWEMLSSGTCVSKEFPEDRLNIDSLHHPDPARQGSVSARGGCFVTEPLGAFDAPFFSITPAEAACMDPQHRRMLEVAYHALEDAGITLNDCSGSETAVYTGSFTDDYRSILTQGHENDSQHAATGLSMSMLANRLSWFFNFKGASVNLDSACSSSLSALHFACRDLQTHNASMALVGGANYVYHPDILRFLSNLNFLSEDSRCWSFDERGNGYARGEGCAVLVLKRLPDALRNGDDVKGVIRATGINQDGRTPGITVPSEDSQVELITKTYRNAGLSMEPTRFFEAHGTGTVQGDPKEANAIGRCFGHIRSADDPLYIGAVKANIGHLEGCSGLAGIIKTLLVLEKGIIPPIAGLHTLNRSIKPELYNLHFPREEISWPATSLRRACVNSFGFGGSNATAILDDPEYHTQLRPPICDSDIVCSNQESPKTCIPISQSNENHATADGNALKSKLQLLDAEHISVPRKLAVWSAFDQESAKQLTKCYANALSDGQSFNEHSLYTMSVRRTTFAWRSFAILDQESDTFRSCFTWPSPGKATAPRQIAFVFTGQGAQYQGMGFRLLGFAAFRKSLSSLDAVLMELGCSWSIGDFLGNTSSKFLIDMPEIAQTLTTCLQIALVDLLQYFGVVPSVILGHSSGEIAASYAAGAVSRSAAVKIAYHRGQVAALAARKYNDLGMMAVALSHDTAIEYIERLHREVIEVEITVACINSPRSVTLSGRKKQLSTIKEWLDEENIFARMLRVPVAYHHSTFMQPLADLYAEAIGSIDARLDGPATTMISSVTGDTVVGQTLRDPKYWISNMVSPVQFHAAFSRALNSQSHASLQVTDILEVGPHSALQGPIRDILSTRAEIQKPAYFSSLSRSEDADLTLLKTVGALYCAGALVLVNNVNQIEHPATALRSSLPKYPFNHSRSYWKESRLSERIRFPQFPRHELLGALIPDSNSHTPQWNNILRIDELPWIDDHRIQGERVLPGAAMLCMAIEAFKQVFIKDMPFQGYELSKVVLKHPIHFPHNVNTVETRLQLSLPPAVSGKSSTWSEFRIFLISRTGDFTECCLGSIRGHASGEGTMPLLRREGSVGDWLTSTAAACTRHMDVQKIYDAATSSDVQYGPDFQVLTQLRVGEQVQAMAEIKPAQRRERSTLSCPSFSPIHPIVLDGMMQLLPLALSQGRQDFPPMMPSRISRLWLNAQPQADLINGHITALARGWTEGYSKAGADIVATLPGSQVPVLCLQAIEGTFIKGSNVMLNTSRKVDPDLCMRLSWEPDISAMTLQQLYAKCVRKRPDGLPEAVERHRKMSLAAYTFIFEALAFIDARPGFLLSKHLLSYVQWMKYQVERLRIGNLPFNEEEVVRLLADETNRQQFIEEVYCAGIEGKMAITMGLSLIPILCEQIDPLNILFGSDGFVDEFYDAMLSDAHHAHPAKALLDLLSFKTPTLNILEVGAGTGGQTVSCLEALSSGGSSKFLRYDYTDISAGFFTKARAKFAKFERLMNFKILDIEKDPINQGFELGKYDIVVASHVIHATASLHESLRNIRKLLKSGGKLLLFETTNPDYLLIGFVFGSLRGWWSPLDSEPRSKYSPCIDVAAWDERLRKSGFSGVDLEFSGQQDAECQYSSIIVATATEDIINGFEPHKHGYTAIVVDPNSPAQHSLAACLEQRLDSSKTLSLAELAQSDQIPLPQTLIFLVEVGAYLVFDMTETEYLHLQSILTKPCAVLWVTQSSSETLDPRYKVIDGMARALRAEDSTRKFVTLMLDKDCRDAHTATNEIMTTIGHLNSPAADLETNIVVVNGVQHIPRITANSDINKMIAQKAMILRRDEVLLDKNMSFVLRPAIPGTLDTLQYQQQDNANLSFNEDEVIIDVHAFGVNFRDYLCASGRLNDILLGSECVGIVRQAGKDSHWKEGDRVAAIGNPLCCTAFKANAKALVAIPDSVELIKACGISGALWTAYHSLITIGRIHKDDIVLIYNAATSTGQLLVQTAQEVGATVFVTARSQACIDLLMATYNLSLSSILDCTNDMLPGEVHQRTSGSGVDIVVGDLDFDASTDYTQLLSPFGRLIHVGVQSHAQDFVPPNQRKDILFGSVDMVEYLRANATAAYRIFQDAMDWASRRHIQAPANLRVFPARETKAAFRSFEENDALDHTVVTLSPGDKIEAYVPNEPSYIFSANSTFVIAGGLGGLGRVFARWLANRGARNLVLLSRSGVKTEAAKTLVADLHTKGVNLVTPICDVTDLSSLHRTVEEISQTMPPIRGCIQATVTLRDATFENMTYEDWKLGLDSKAAGSWNLHLAMPDGLDFFVIVASLNGIFGGRGQANYTAGNTFKDGLAHYRISCGQKAVSIDPGLVVDEGVVSENQTMLTNLRRGGYLKEIYVDDLVALLEHYCDPNLPILKHEDAQVLLGAELPSIMISKGIDVHHFIHRPIARHLFVMGAGNEQEDKASSVIDRAAALRAATSKEAAEKLATEWFAGQISHVLGLPIPDLDKSKPIHTYGIDSLLVIDLKNWLQKELGAKLSVVQLLSNLSIAELGVIAAAKSSFRKVDGVKGASVTN